MVTEVFPLEQAVEAMEYYMNGKGGSIRVAIKP
jgi:hypothetical protein